MVVWEWIHQHSGRWRFKSLATSASLRHKCVRWSCVQSLQGKFTLRFSFFPSPALSFCFPLLSLSLGLLLFFPPLRLFQPFLLFPSGCWSPFGFFDDCIECTSTDWVALEDPDEVDPPTDFVVESAGFTLVDPTMPSA
jgi:hypothetical protein